MIEEVLTKQKAFMKYFEVIQSKQKALLGLGEENSELIVFTFICVHQ